MKSVIAIVALLSIIDTTEAVSLHSHHKHHHKKHHEKQDLAIKEEPEKGGESEVSKAMTEAGNDAKKT